MARPAAFLDRDGVLNVDHGYVHRIEDWEWTPGAIDAIRSLNDAGYLVLVVTNQSGIARGMYAADAVERLHAEVVEQLAAAGARIDRIYLCPHGPDDDCDCRKPKPGMIRQAFAEFDIDPARSFLIGDKASDIEAAAAAGLRGYMVAGNLLSLVRAILADEILPADVS